MVHFNYNIPVPSAKQVVFLVGKANFSTTMGWRIRTAYGVGLTVTRLGIVVLPFTMLVVICISGPIGLFDLLRCVYMISITSRKMDTGVKAGVHDTVMIKQLRGDFGSSICERGIMKIMIKTHA